MGLLSEDAGTFEYQNCRVCGEKFDVAKDILSATSVGEARIGKKHLHDEMTCRNSGQDWHDQALCILIEAEKTASTKLAGLLRAEALELVTKKQATTPGFRKSPLLR
jgi:ribosomal protein L37E